MSYAAGVLVRLPFGVLYTVILLIFAPIVYGLVFLSTMVSMLAMPLLYVGFALQNDNAGWERHWRRFSRGLRRSLHYLPGRLGETWDWVWAET